MALSFDSVNKPENIDAKDWFNWTWQMKNGPKNRAEFSRYIELTKDESSYFDSDNEIFKSRGTPYYMSIAAKNEAVRKIIVPRVNEFKSGNQEMKDPLGEEMHSPTARIVHRYPDRVLFLATDICSVYCRYCTRKYFTGNDQALINTEEYEMALTYIKSHPEIKEVILSGGDPLTLSDKVLFRILKDLRSINHIEIIRVGTRMPVVNPMRITNELALGIREYGPVFLMTHFNHPKELTLESSEALSKIVDHGIPAFNQMVFLNGVNNHTAIVKALSRQLLFLRVKPYYMFQCDPSMGTDHLRTSIEESEAIQKELWGKLSGLAMPNLSIDIPNGGGKVGIVPNFEITREDGKRIYRGWDGKKGEYINPPTFQHELPPDFSEYL
ncbi:MAG: lysine 2,3-aminomutase [Proteobacteria bacterium SG_bin7]|nr:MAG: lysine 2,3-aminomutase [Proteobacteria bacterium SG_bin7]